MNDVDFVHKQKKNILQKNTVFLGIPPPAGENSFPPTDATAIAAGTTPAGRPPVTGDIPTTSGTGTGATETRTGSAETRTGATVETVPFMGDGTHIILRYR